MLRSLFFNGLMEPAFSLHPLFSAVMRSLRLVPGVINDCPVWECYLYLGFIILSLADTPRNKLVGDFPSETVSFVSLIINDFAPNYTAFYRD